MATYIEGTVHFLTRVWREERYSRPRICQEVDFLRVYGDPELILNIKNGRRPGIDWIEESFDQFLKDDPETYLPDIEICEEPVLVEVIGTVRLSGFRDSYTGEYDEDCELEIREWTIEFDDE